MSKVSPFLSVQETAKEFRVGRNRIYQAIKNKELRAYRPNSKVFLLNPVEVTEWIFKNPL